MPPSRWTDDFAIQVKQVDVANESLFYLIAHLFDDGVECMGRFCLGRASCRKIDSLIRFLSRNLAAEEVLMERSRYPGRQEHCTEHARVLNRLAEWRDLPLCHTAYRERVSFYMLDWAITHVTSADRKLGQWLRSGDSALASAATAETASLMPRNLLRTAPRPVAEPPFDGRLMQFIRGSAGAK